MDSGGKHKKGAVGKGKGDEGVSWVGGVDTIMREVGNGSVKREVRQKRVSAQQSWPVNGRNESWGGVGGGGCRQW